MAHELDRLAARALPAAVAEEHGGWLLRSTPSRPETKRVNSALAYDVAPSLEVVERWYAERGAAPVVLVSPSDALVQVVPDGWETLGASVVLVADPDDVVDALGGPAFRVVPGELPSDRAEGPDPVVPLVAAEGAGRVVVVLQERWAYVYDLAVDPTARRGGIASALMRAAARLAEGRRIYLQVEEGNAAALALYAKAGFSRSHGYHYRRGPLGPVRGAGGGTR